MGRQPGPPTSDRTKLIEEEKPSLAPGCPLRHLDANCLNGGIWGTIHWVSVPSTKLPMSSHVPDAAPKFNLGRVVITRGAQAVLEEDDVKVALTRHRVGDWGDLCQEDAALNDAALTDEARVLSVYFSSKGVRFYVITEWDRSYTTILLPSEY